MSDKQDHVETEDKNEDHSNDNSHGEAIKTSSTTAAVNESTDGHSPVETDTGRGITGDADPSIELNDGMVDSDGFEHHVADASHRNVYGAENRKNAIQGSDGDDTITGGSQDDVLSGGDGNDDITGGAGDDVLVGGGSTDTGVNHLDGSAGNDILVAGGAKTRHFSELLASNGAVNTTVHTNTKYADIASIADGSLGVQPSHVENNFEIHSANGNDVIVNFHASTDKITIDRGLNGSDIWDAESLLRHISVNGNDVDIDCGSGNHVTLAGVDVANLSLANIAWA